MQTTLIGPDNKVAQTWGGNGWDPDAVAAAVKATAYKVEGRQQCRIEDIAQTGMFPCHLLELPAVALLSSS